MLTRYVKLSIGASHGVPPRVAVSQYDTIWRFVFTIYDGYEVHHVPSNATVTMTGRKPDGTVFVYAGSADGVNAIVDCQEQMVASAGRVECELRIGERNESVVNTVNFVLDVEPAPLNGYIMSGNEFSAINDILNEAIETAQSIQRINPYVTDHVLFV